MVLSKLKLGIFMLSFFVMGEVCSSVASLSSINSFKSIDESSEGALFEAYSARIVAYRQIFNKILDREGHDVDVAEEQIKKLVDEINTLYPKCLRFFSQEDHSFYNSLWKISQGTIAPFVRTEALPIAPAGRCVVSFACAAGHGLPSISASLVLIRARSC